jgi:hypothetical protein
VNGRREFVQWGPFEQGDVRDRERLEQVIRFHKPAAIIHFAGLIEVTESIANPIAFFDNNVSGSVNLFAAALLAGIDKVVFFLNLRDLRNSTRNSNARNPPSVADQPFWHKQTARGADIEGSRHLPRYAFGYPSLFQCGRLTLEGELESGTILRAM